MISNPSSTPISSNIDLQYCTSTLLELLRIPSPSGFTSKAVSFVEAELTALGVAHYRTPKGALVWTLSGKSGGVRSVASHIDTLGAMIKEVKPNGRLRLSAIGGYDWATVEGAECKVHHPLGHTLSGTVVNTRQSTHVHGAALRKLRRSEESMEVRLDADVRSAEEVHALGFSVGDFVSFDSLALETETGFIKGRHLDNKAAVAICLAVTKALVTSGRQPETTVHFFVSNYEEVGHGAAAGIPDDTQELLCIDMAAIGQGQTSDEYSVTLCVKDASGPYDYDMNAYLKSLAQAQNIDLKVDIYPYYRSDASAAWRSGGSYRAALIGPGVDASHAFERMHKQALQATSALLEAYLLAPLVP